MATENFFENIFWVFGIIVFAMLMIWLGVKLIQSIKDPPRNSNLDAPNPASFVLVPSTLYEELNERIANQKNHSVHRCSDTGL